MLNKFYGRLATVNYWLFVAVYSIVNLFDFVGRLVLFPFVTLVFVLCAILDLLKESVCELPQAFLWIIEPFKSIGFSVNEKAYVLQWLENNKNKRGE